jgi:hypothetical protein
MTLGRVRQLPASRGQAGYRAQARLAFPALEQMRSVRRWSLLGRAGKDSPSLRFASGTTAVTGLVITDAARRGMSGAARGGSHQQPH